MNLKLSPPKVITWWIAVIVGVVGILAELTTILPSLKQYAIPMIIVAFLLLAVATLVDGL